MDNHAKIALLRADKAALMLEVQQLETLINDPEKHTNGLFDKILYERQKESRLEAIDKKDQAINTLLEATQIKLF